MKQTTMWTPTILILALTALTPALPSVICPPGSDPQGDCVSSQGTTANNSATPAVVFEGPQDYNVIETLRVILDSIINVIYGPGDNQGEEDLGNSTSITATSTGEIEDGAGGSLYTNVTFVVNITTDGDTSDQDNVTTTTTTATSASVTTTTPDEQEEEDDEVEVTTTGATTTTATTTEDATMGITTTTTVATTTEDATMGITTTTTVATTTEDEEEEEEQEQEEEEVEEEAEEEEEDEAEEEEEESEVESEAESEAESEEEEDSLVECDACLFQHGIAYNPHPRDCALFVQCVLSPKLGVPVVAGVHACPPPLLWNQAQLTCDFQENVQCQDGERGQNLLQGIPCP